MVNQRSFQPAARWAATIAAALLLAVGLALASPGAAQAGPPAPIDIPLTQPDGTQITARQWGDEWQNGLETVDGYTILQDEASGYYVYAELAPEGTLRPALVDGQPLIAGEHAPAGLAPQLRPAPAADPAPVPLNLLNAPAQSDAIAAPPAQASGTKPMLLILAYFNNRAPTYSPADFYQKIFGETGSVRDYYRAASFGKLDFVPASESYGDNDGVVGWVKLNFDHPSALSDYHSNHIARAALEAANGSVNYAQFDWDGDGYVTSKELQVVIIAAGYEGSYVKYYPYMWAHQYSLDAWPLTLDGKRVGQNSIDGDWGGYSIFGEIHRDGSDSHVASIGVMAHEIGHLLGWPDLYDTDTTQNWQGVGEWSIMGSGSWNGLTVPGDSPSLPDAWLKWYMGWINPASATPYATRTMIPKAESNPFALLVGSNPGGVDWRFYNQSGSGQGQYWLVENRQQKGYDAGLPGCGLLIWHVHEDVSTGNDANANRDYPLLALEQADGYNDLYNNFNRGDSGDPYPGWLNRVAFGPTTNPNSKFQYSDKSTEDSNYTVNLQSTGCADWMYLTFSNGAPALALAEKLYLPVVYKGPIYATGTIRSNGAPLPGQTVRVWYSTNDGTTYAAYGSPAVTDATGKYSVPLPPLLAAETRYFVRWENTANNSGLLRSFDCNSRSGLDANHTCDMEVAGINLVAPSNGAAIRFPRLFEWTRRAFITDTYAVQIYQSNGTTPIGFFGYFGYVSSGTVTVAPPGTTTGVNYAWSVRVKTPSGVGFAYQRFGIRFDDLSGPPLEFAPGPAWVPLSE